MCIHDDHGNLLAANAYSDSSAELKVSDNTTSETPDLSGAVAVSQLERE